MQSSEKNAIDLAEVERLVQALERDLENMQGSAENYGALRAEVEALRQALRGDETQLVREHLHGVHGFLDEAAETAFKGSRYLADIGRMLGM
jgi:hypothetical protein